MADGDDDYFSPPSYTISLPTIPGLSHHAPHQQPETRRYDLSGTAHDPNDFPNEGQAAGDKRSVIVDPTTSAGAQHVFYLSCSSQYVPDVRDAGLAYTASW